MNGTSIKNPSKIHQWSFQMFYNGARKAALKRAQAVEEQYNSLAEQGNRLSLDLYSHRKLYPLRG